MSQSKARAARKGGLREQLARKRAKIVTLYFPADDEGEQSIKRVDEAERDLQFGKLMHARQGKESKVDIPVLEAAVAAAEAYRDEHCLELSVRGLSEDERDALMSAYLGEEIPDGASPEERKRIIDSNTAKNKEWTYHALAVVAQDSDLTAEEWRAELTSDRWSAGDVVKIREGILEAYGAQPAENIPKG